MSSSAGHPLQHLSTPLEAGKQLMEWGLHTQSSRKTGRRLRNIEEILILFLSGKHCQLVLNRFVENETVFHGRFLKRGSGHLAFTASKLLRSSIFNLKFNFENNFENNYSLVSLECEIILFLLEIMFKKN